MAKQKPLSNLTLKGLIEKYGNELFANCDLSLALLSATFGGESIEGYRKKLFDKLYRDSIPLTAKEYAARLEEQRMAARDRLLNEYCGDVAAKYAGLHVGGCDIWLLLLSGLFAEPMSVTRQLIFDAAFNHEIPLTASEQADRQHKKLSFFDRIREKELHA